MICKLEFFFSLGKKNNNENKNGSKLKNKGFKFFGAGKIINNNFPALTFCVTFFQIFSQSY